MKIREIDLSEFEGNVSDYPGLAERLESARQRLFDETERTNVAIHEAAHAYYFLKAGIVRVDYCATAPHISSGKIRVGLASVTYSSEHVFKTSGMAVAKACAAGAAATKYFTGHTGGDGADKQALLNAFAKFPDLASVQMLVDAMWNTAIDEINRDLENPAVRMGILQIAKHFEAWLLCEHDENGWSGDWASKWTTNQES